MNIDLNAEMPEMPSKTEWPELVGKDGEEAKAKILEEFPKLTVFTVKVGSMVTMDYRMDRVRVWVNASGVVARLPKVG